MQLARVVAGHSQSLVNELDLSLIQPTPKEWPSADRRLMHGPLDQQGEGAPSNMRTCTFRASNQPDIFSLWFELHGTVSCLLSLELT